MAMVVMVAWVRGGGAVAAWAAGRQAAAEDTGSAEEGRGRLMREAPAARRGVGGSLVAEDARAKSTAAGSRGVAWAETAVVWAAAG